MSNIKTHIILLLLICISFLSFSPAHKFYVSLTEIRFIQNSHEIQVSMRVFPDDLDRAIGSIHGINPNIGTELENENAQDWINSYLKDNFALHIGDKDIKLSYLGLENESDAVWLFLEGHFRTKIHDLTIKNQILIKEFEDQKNIVQVYYKNDIKSLLLSKDNMSGSLTFNKQ